MRQFGFSGETPSGALLVLAGQQQIAGPPKTRFKRRVQPPTKKRTTELKTALQGALMLHALTLAVPLQGKGLAAVKKRGSTRPAHAGPAPGGSLELRSVVQAGEPGSLAFSSRGGAA
jgi:hypothetical protein